LLTPKGVRRHPTDLNKDSMLDLLGDLFLSLEKIIDGHSSKINKKLVNNCNSLIEFKNSMQQNQDVFLTKFKSLQFVSDNNFSSLKKLEAVPSISNELKTSSESLNSKFTKMYVSNSNHLLEIKEDLNSMKENWMQSNQTLQKLSEEPLLDNLRTNLAELSSTLFNNFETFQERSFIQHSEDVQVFSQQQTENFSKLLESVETIKNLLINVSHQSSNQNIEKNISSKHSSKSSCHKKGNKKSTSPAVEKTQQLSGYVCPCHDKILELKLDHELWSELNDKVENMIDLTTNPVQALENRFLAFEKESKERFDILLGLSTSSQSNQNNTFDEKGKARATAAPSVPQGNSQNKPD
jgi:hypothetical protein